MKAQERDPQVLLHSEKQEIRDVGQEEAETGGRDRQAGQGQEEEDLARQVI
jgi:hypothetical protein